ncbi:WGR domain-containing protein [Chitinophaga flava]|uniref:WGR domain-containing protein n=1 Tax=Chitinophaga flava TaxID=2259036 RepID=A0A365XQA7_9BACT|nr:WGR domain-containing protein [Chitinophaga flava]RBL88201.1 hypothetical protein DF182_16505 [Chitinophaga flava]
MKKRFIYQDEKSNKFWDIEIKETELTVTFGKTGTQGQSQTKTFSSAEECNKAAEKLITEKTKKGYTELAETTHSENEAIAPGTFPPPAQLYNNILSLAAYLETHWPEKVEIYPVSEEHIGQMESTAGFSMPTAFRDFWLKKGFFYFDKDDITCAIYAYNTEGPNANTLYAMLDLFLNIYNRESIWLEQEKDFLSQCCWLLGLIVKDEERWYIVVDPLGQVYNIHTPQSLSDVTDEDFIQAFAPLLSAKASLSAFIKAGENQAPAHPEIPPAYLQPTASLMDVTTSLLTAEGISSQMITNYELENVEEETGFPLPSTLMAFWRKHGSILYNNPSPVPPNFYQNIQLFFPSRPYMVNYKMIRFGLYDFLETLLKPKTVRPFEEEKEYLNQCFLVYGMMNECIEGLNFVECFYCAADGSMGSIRFLNALPFDIHWILAPVMALKDKQTYAIQHLDAVKADQEKAAAMAEQQEAADEENETATFLQKHRLQKLSYREVLERLGVDNLFDYWEVENEGNNYTIEEYESEEEYFEDDRKIYFCDGDLVINGDLDIPHTYFHLLVVNGDMTINGRIPDRYGESTPYYVTGNTTADCLSLGYFQKTCGEENIRYIATAWAQDDEALNTLPHRKINAPYFFSWFYSLDCFDFAPHTLITALYEEERLSAYETDNAFLPWHDFAYAFQPAFYYRIEERYHDTLSIDISAMYEALRNNKPILAEGVTLEGIQLVPQGLRLKNEEDLAGAYTCFKKAITLSPGYYWPYYYAGECLLKQQAYAQAMTYYAKGIAYTPEKMQYEYSCMEKAALCAVRIGEYDKAIEWAEMAIQKHASAYFPMRVIGEALILQNRLDEAKNYLEKSIGIHDIFSNNWLLGLAYYLQGDQEQADVYYKAAVSKNSKAKPYTQHTDLTYIYGEPVTVNWDTKQASPKVKDQAYWDEFLATALSQYGPDLYTRTGQFPDYWISAKIVTIPAQYRTQDMLLALLRHQTNGEYDVNGNILESFDQELITQEIVMLAMDREAKCHYKNIPAHLLTMPVFEASIQQIDLSYVPAELITYEFCFRAVSINQYNYNHVPEAFRDERMNIALIAGGGLRNYPCKELPSRYHTTGYIKSAIDLGIHVIKNIPVKLVDKEVYEYAAAKYGQDPEWPFITEQYDRQRWRYGSSSDVEWMGQQVRKYGISAFLHINPARINQHSYQYFKKHLGHLPEFEQNVKTYGWDQRIKVTDPDIREFDYDTFEKVWACFWDEDFIIKAITANTQESCERIYTVPHQYLTQKICDIAVQRNSYDFQFVPKQFVTAQMCETACSLDYGTALEYVPLELRTEKVCDLALSRDTENIKFVPIPLRSVQRCIRAVQRGNWLYKYVPYEHYTTVFETLCKNQRNSDDQDFRLLYWGLGLIIDKKYNDAREKLMEVETVKEAYSCYKHQALYYIGWSYFLEGDTAAAKEYWTKAQDLAKTDMIEKTDWLTFPYSDFQLIPVAGGHPFSKDEFDSQMREVTLLIGNKDYTQAIELLAQTEKLLQDSQCTEIGLWAYVWDHQRYALYEAGMKDASLTLCRKIITELEKVTLWDYLEEFNPVRAALRNAHNNLAYHYYETATSLDTVMEGIKHIKVTMKTTAPIEEKSVLNPFYETQVLLWHKAMSFDPARQKEFQKVVDKITKLKLREKGELSDGLMEKLGI